MGLRNSVSPQKPSVVWESPMNGTNGAISEAVATPQRLLTLPEAARYLGCKLWSVRELIWKGQIPCTRIGGRLQVDVRDLDGLAEAEDGGEGCGDPSLVCAGRGEKVCGASD